MPDKLTCDDCVHHCVSLDSPDDEYGDHGACYCIPNEGQEFHRQYCLCLSDEDEYPDARECPVFRASKIGEG